MSVVIPPGFGEATLVFDHTAVARQARVIIGFQDANLLTADAIAEDIRDATWSTWDTRFEDSCTLIQTRVIINRAGVMIAGLSGATDAGSGGAFAVGPPNVALKIYKSTGLAGRHQRGASFFPPWVLTETNIADDGQITGSVVTALQTVADTWLANLETAQLNMHLLHDETAPSTTPTEVVALSVSNLIATQRRRIRPLS